MARRAVHQIVAGFVEGDAISNHALALQKIFRAWGRGSEIFCPLRHISPRMRGRARDLAAHRAEARPGDLTLFHFSIGSETVDYFRALPPRASSSTTTSRRAAGSTPSTTSGSASSTAAAGSSPGSPPSPTSASPTPPSTPRSSWRRGSDTSR